MKKLLKILLILALLAALHAGVVFVANNVRADQLEKLLRNDPLPGKTTLVDSASVAGKLTGNGNGMQYRGAVLLRSELSEEELRAYYQSHFPNQELTVTALATADAQNADILFPSYVGTDDCFQVELFEDLVVGAEKSWWESILNSDLRGH